MAEKVAIVTGSNKGIGFAIVKKLCKEFDGIVYLTARNKELGEKALADLKNSLTNQKCKQVRFYRLDINDKSTIIDLKNHVIKEHGGLDILVNNAGIAYKMASTAPFSEQAEKTTETNYFATKDVCDALFPILRPHARVVNVSSQSGLLKQVPSAELRSKFSSETLTVDQLDELVKKFVEYAKHNQHKEHGYSGSAYSMSKVALSALTFIQQRNFNKDKREDLVVNACCPGYVDTDMSSHKGHLTPDEGAETPTYLAMLPKNVEKPKGAFVYLKKETDWLTGDPI